MEISFSEAKDFWSWMAQGFVVYKEQRWGYQRRGGSRRRSREPGEVREDHGGETQSTGDTAPHMKNFFDAIRARDYKLLNAEIEIGARSAAFCHLANIAYQCGRTLRVDKTGRFSAMRRRMRC